MSEIVFDSFLSYSTTADYRLARRVEAFLEGFHATSAGRLAEYRPLQICRDGSDVRQWLTPLSKDEDGLWARIRSRLETSQRLVVLCSPASARAPWVQREVQWMVENRGRDAVLLALTAGDNPVERPEVVFPPAVLAERLHESQIWYDLRGFSRSKDPKLRDPEDELVRLALDLLGIDKPAQADAVSVWRREEAKRVRRFAWMLATVSLVVTLLAGAAGLSFLEARRNAESARVGAILRAAEAEADPLRAGLLLVEATKSGHRLDALGIAYKVLEKQRPTAVLRGHRQAILGGAFLGNDSIATIDRSGVTLVWPAHGRGDPRRILDRDARRVTAVAISPSDRLAVIAREGGDITLADLSGQQGTKACATGLDQRELAFNPSDGTVAARGYTDAIATCDFATGRGNKVGLPSRPVAIWTGDHAGEWLAFTDTGDFWRVPTSAPPARLDAWSLSPSERGEYERVRLVERSKDGKILAILVAKTLFVIDSRNQGPTRRSRIGAGGMTGPMRFSPDASVLAVATSTGVVRRFRLAQLPNEIDPLEPPLRARQDLEESPFHDLAFSPDGAAVATVGWGSSALVWAADDRRALETYDGHSGADRLVWSADGRRFATLSDTGTVRVWHSPRSAPRVARRVPDNVHSGDLSFDGRWLAIGTVKSGIFMGASASESSLPNVVALSQILGACPANDARATTVRILTFDSQSASLWAGLDNGILARWPLSSDGLLGPGKFACTGASSFSFDRRAARMAGLTPDGRLLLWDGTSAPHEHAAAPGGPYSRLRFSNNGKHAVAAGADGFVAYWLNVGSPNAALHRMKAHDGSVMCVSLGDEPWALLSTGMDGLARWWAATDGPATYSLRDPDGKWMESCEWDASARRAFVTASSGRLWEWNPAHQQDARLIGTSDEIAQVGPVGVLEVSRAGARVWTGGLFDGMVRMWSREAGAPQIAHFFMEGAVTVLSEAGSTERVLLGGESGLVRVLPTTVDGVRAALNASTSATLTAREREKALGEPPRVARERYEVEESRQGRTPLEATWRFEMPF